MFAIRQKIRVIQSTYGWEIGTDRYREIVCKLDALTVTQCEVSQAVKELCVQHGRTQPTKRTWGIALLALLISVAVICAATSGIIHISLINGQAATLHEQAQAERSQAVEGVVETIAPFDQAITARSSFQHAASQLPLKADNAMLTVISSAEKLLRQADSLDVQADGIANSTAFGLYVAEIVLVIGSAIAGGIISWAITQTLINNRRRPARATERAQ